MAPNNSLPIWGNEKTMNLNPLILTNIQSSPYFKVNLYELKTYHEVIDEIYYKVEHLEPWEKGSRKTAGQTGMCGGVRGVGAGGIVSSAYCLLYKLFTLRLTRKQLQGLITHKDSPYIRGLGFMYVRYTQDPKELWDWYEPYLDDEEEIDVKAGGGHQITMGEMLRQWLVKLEWYSTLFPRIPVPVQKDLVQKLKDNPPEKQNNFTEPEVTAQPRHIPDGEVSFGEAERYSQTSRSSAPKDNSRPRSPRRSPPRRSPSRRSPHRRSRSPRRRPSPRRSPKRSPHRRSPRRSPPRRQSPSRKSPHSSFDFAKELERERRRQNREKEPGSSSSSSRHRSRSRDRKRRSRSKDRSRKHSRSRSREKHSKRRSKSRDRKRHKERKSPSRSGKYSDGES